MGGCPMGGYGWGGNILEQELIDSVNAALENGVNFFDTADVYGLGQSEITLGKALKGKRDKAVIATKFGVCTSNGKTVYNNCPEYIEKALEGSLKRLNTDYIDLYQVHYRDGKTPISVVIETLEKLREKGYIRYFGLSNIHNDDIEELKEQKGKFVSFQDEYSLACRKNEKDMFILSDELNLTPFTWGSLGQGILTGKYDINTKFDADDRRSREIYVNFHGEKLKKNLQIVEEMKKISSENTKSLPAIAIRFTLDYIKESVVLVGVKRPAQLLSNIEAMDWNLTDEQISELLKISD
ncbi:MAG: aldo/keto reductase [Ruminococcus sp.]|nr:aldo/keto reductase [Ruminococcus sp.]